MNITINDMEKTFLFNLVELVLHTAVTEERFITEKEVPSIPVGILQEKMGAFVTYSLYSKANPKHKDLRGCIGLMQAEHPLWVNVARMAYSAAREDTRFMPISKEELDRIDFDITVLGPFSVCPNKDDIILGKHGIMLEARGTHAVFLPQVPTEQNWTLQETFEHLCAKAGLPKNAWQEEGTLFYWYEGLVLHRK